MRLQAFEVDLDDSNTECRLPTWEGRGRKVAGGPGGRPDAVKAARPVPQGVCEVRPVRQIDADKTGRLAPIACGRRLPVKVEEIKRRRSCGFVDSLKVAVGVIDMPWIVRRLQEIHHHRMVLKQVGKIVEPVQFRCQQCCVAVKLNSFLLNRPLRPQAKCNIPGKDDGERHEQ